MALTLHTEPQELTPAYNDQIFTAVSDQVAVSDFKYIVTVVVNGDTANTYTEDILQRPDGWLVFNAKQWVQNYIEHYFELDDVVLAYPINLATNKNVAVQVKIKEYYTAAIQSTTTINYQAFDACLTDAEFRAYDYSDYIFGATTGLYFLSKDINTITPDNRLALNQPMFIHFINNGTTIDNIIITLRRSGSAIDTVSIASLPSPVNTHDIYQLFIDSTMFTIATPAVGDIIRVDFLQGAVSLLRYSITLADICTKYKDYVIYYLDRDGNIVNFHFEQKSKKNFTKKVNSVTLNKNVLNTSTGDYNSKSYDREEHIVSTAIESTMDLYTNWLTQTQIESLNDLWSTPIAYIWDGTTLKSCTIKNLGFEEYQLNNEPLNVLNITIDLGITETRQRGI
jgi:hypothetical protein